ncbi:TATA-binding protein-associated phosphoprotein [Entamoeba marina]
MEVNQILITSVKTKGLNTTERYIKYRNYQAYEQSTFIYLINQYCDIEFCKVGRSCKTTAPFLHIKKLNFSDDVIDVEGFIKKRCSEIMEKDIHNKVSMKTASRRYYNNKIIETNHMLMDFLIEKGYHFKERRSAGRNQTSVTSTALKIFYDSNSIFKHKEILNHGKMVNNYLMKCIKKDTSFILLKNDVCFNRLTKEYFNSNEIKHSDGNGFERKI